MAAIKYFKQKRQQEGSITLLALVAVLAIVIPAILFFSGIFENWITQRRLSTAAEQACLVAAQNLSKIVISDPYWGFISLSDYPASGRATLAGDGEPLPVTGINTIVGTARLELIVAESLGDSSMIDLAMQDVRAARLAGRRLENALIDSLRADRPDRYTDMNGDFINPHLAVEKSVKSYLEKTGCPSGQPQLKELRLNLGWLEEGAETITPVPGPTDLAKVDKSNAIGDCYAAFRNIAVGNECFYFAGVSKQAGLVNVEQFRNPDGERICSVVRIELKVDCNTDSESSHTITTTACALPDAMPDYSQPGVLVLNFPQGRADRLRSIRDLISSTSTDNRRVELMQAVNGDFPIDPGSQLTELPENISTTSYLLAMGFRDWIRNAHCKMRLDSLLEAANNPFPCSYTSSGQPVMLLYDVDRKGNIITRQFSDGICLKETVSDKQRYAYINSGDSLNNRDVAIKFRDHVNVLTRQDGGKHAGQALVDELPVEYSSPSAAENRAELLANLADDSSRLRRSYLHSGLAVSLEIIPAG